MATIKAFVKGHPLLTYFALVFAISWGGVLIVVGPGGLPAANKEQFETLFPIAILAMVAGPSVAGILLTGLVYGKAGLREFLSRLLKWRVGSPLVRRCAPNRPARVHSGMPRALANLVRVSPRHTHIRRQSVRSADGHLCGAHGGHLRGAGLDGVRHAYTA